MEIEVIKISDIVIMSIISGVIWDGLKILIVGIFKAIRQHFKSGNAESGGSAPDQECKG